ncbi:5-formyltetrahydrofolate cyclo-ligase, partial [Microbacterium lacticum]
MPDAIDDAKRALRADLRERRQQHSDAVRAAAAEGVKVQLDALVASLGARSVSCFLSTPTEPGTHDFIMDAMARGIRV